jgi:hypothetical protein
MAAFGVVRGGVARRFCGFRRLCSWMRRLVRPLLLGGTAQHHERENRRQYQAGTGVSKQMQK